eukprot:TRINITY_DN6850_c0_g1_i1.p1 TRINITY_DN6850_c0_g1~~TRINITY_DN6850_c0_g1_i1.p1  ORF type:complete len:413 (+),score=67.54 TRINITY_DN6850_c0_g1_i1:78-1316(+)
MELPGFDLVRHLGRGNHSASVDLYSRSSDGALFAVKTFEQRGLRRQRSLRRGRSGPQDPMEAVRREIAVMKKISHPNCVGLESVIEHEGTIAMVLEYVDGGSLAEQPTPISDPRMRTLLRDIVLGLEFLHCHEVVHRDIKPENILLTGAGYAKLADFGVSQLTPSRDGTSDDCLLGAVGTPAFLAPECCTGELYHAKEADVWALGVLLFWSSTGTVPFRAASQIELMRQISNSTVPDFEASPGRQSLVTRLLAKVPEERISLDQVKIDTWVTEHHGPMDTVQPLERQYVSEADLANAVVELSLVNKVMNRLRQLRRQRLVEPACPEERGEQEIWSEDSGSPLSPVGRALCKDTSLDDIDSAADQLQAIEPTEATALPTIYLEDSHLKEEQVQCEDSGKISKRVTWQCLSTEI